MPNTPAAIGRGITVACANPLVTAEQRQLSDELLAAIGERAWVEDEALLDPVTAVSGSGPAYVFWLMEQLAAAAQKLGLPKETSMKLALHTVLGAAKLAASSGEPPAVLRRNVTSKGGTTEAALKVFDTERLAERFARAVEAASRRATELGSELGKD
jgi:pyrroline-5-carboxylate reductase